jgi:hypothetical protein
MQDAPSAYSAAVKAYMLCLACNCASDAAWQPATAVTATPARQGATPWQILASLRKVEASLAAALAATPGTLPPARVSVSDLEVSVITWRI